MTAPYFLNDSVKAGSDDATLLIGTRDRVTMEHCFTLSQVVASASNSVGYLPSVPTLAVLAIQHCWKHVQHPGTAWNNAQWDPVLYPKEQSCIVWSDLKTDTVSLPITTGIYSQLYFVSWVTLRIPIDFLFINGKFSFVRNSSIIYVFFFSFVNLIPFLRFQSHYPHYFQLDKEPLSLVSICTHVGNDLGYRI